MRIKPCLCQLRRMPCQPPIQPPQHPPPPAPCARDGRRSGHAEGKALGLQKGFEMGHEVGYYASCCQLWRQLQAQEPQLFRSVLGEAAVLQACLVAVLLCACPAVLCTLALPHQRFQRLLHPWLPAASG